MDVSYDQFKEILDHYGVALLMVGWFMLRHERNVGRLIRLINRLVVSHALVLRTLDLEEEQNALLEDLSKGDGNQ